jgi:hypothetical protein
MDCGILFENSVTYNIISQGLATYTIGMWAINTYNMVICQAAAHWQNYLAIKKKAGKKIWLKQKGSVNGAFY